MQIKYTSGTQTVDLFDLQSITACYGNTTYFLFSVNYFWTSMGICKPLQPETLKVSCLGTRAKEIRPWWASKHQQQCVLQSWSAGSGTLAPNKNMHDNGRHAVFAFRQVREGKLQLKENSLASEGVQRSRTFFDGICLCTVLPVPVCHSMAVFIGL